MRVLQILLLTLALTTSVWAQPPASGIFAQALKIAEPDQVEAWNQLKLSSSQTTKIQSILMGYLPVVRERGAEPAALLPLVPQVWAEVEAQLTPQQKPLARRLLPRPHQWAKIQQLYKGFRSR